MMNFHQYGAHDQNDAKIWVFFLPTILIPEAIWMGFKSHCAEAAHWKTAKAEDSDINSRH